MALHKTNSTQFNIVRLRFMKKKAQSFDWAFI